MNVDLGEDPNKLVVVAGVVDLPKEKAGEGAFPKENAAGVLSEAAAGTGAVAGGVWLTPKLNLRPGVSKFTPLFVDSFLGTVSSLGDSHETQ